MGRYLQVEHTITEEVMGVDLVCTQIEIASGKTLAELKLRQKDIGSSVIVISAHSEVDNIMEVARLGAADFIPKPFQSEDEMLEDVL